MVQRFIRFDSIANQIADGNGDSRFAYSGFRCSCGSVILLLALLLSVSISDGVPSTQELSIERGDRDASLTWKTPFGDGGAIIPTRNEGSTGGETSNSFSRLVAVVFPPEGGDVLFVGVAEPGKPPLDPQELLDAFVLAFRARRIGQAPGVTIDPTAEQLARGVVENDRMNVRYFGKVEETLFGWVAFEADRLMKCLSFGRDNITKKPFTCQVPGYRNEMDLLDAAGSRSKQSWHRFWIELLESRMSVSRSGQVYMPDVRLCIKTEYMVPRGGKLEPGNCPPDPAAKAFADHMTQSYAGYAEEFPVYRKLQTFAQLTSVAEAIQPPKEQVAGSSELRPSLDLQWVMNDYPTTPFKTPSITPATVISRTNETQRGNVHWTHTRQLSGGVTLRPQNTYRTADRQADAIEQVVFARPPEQRGREWTANFSGGEYRVASRKLSSNELRLWQTDMRVGSVGIVRQYSASKASVPTSFGPHWELQQPKLWVAATTVELKDGKRVPEAIYLEDAQNKVTVLDRHVTLTMPGQPPAEGFSTRDGQKKLRCYSNRWILTEGDVHFVSINKGPPVMEIPTGSRVVHFSPEKSHDALLIKTTTDSITHTYENGQIKRISDDKGNSITLTRDTQGRCTGLSASNGEHISYSFDGNGNLTAVSDGKGRSITYQNNPATAEPVAIQAEFDHLPVIASARRRDVPSLSLPTPRSETRSSAPQPTKPDSLGTTADLLRPTNSKASQIPADAPPWILVLKDTVSESSRPAFEQLERNALGAPDSSVAIAVGDNNADYRAHLMTTAKEGRFRGKIVFLAACGTPEMGSWVEDFIKTSGSVGVWRFSEPLTQRIATAFVEEFQKQFQKQLDAQKGVSGKPAMLDQTFAQALDATIRTLQNTKDFETRDIEKFRSVLLQEGGPLIYSHANNRGLAAIPEQQRRPITVQNNPATTRITPLPSTSRIENRPPSPQPFRPGNARTIVIQIERTRNGLVLVKNGVREPADAKLLSLAQRILRNKDKESIEAFRKALGVEPGSEIILSAPNDMRDKIALAGKFADLQINVATDLSKAQKNKASQLPVDASPWILVFKDTVSKSFRQAFERLEKNAGTPDALVIAVGDNNTDYRAHLMTAAKEGRFRGKVVFLAACGTPEMGGWVEKFIEASGAVGVCRFGNLLPQRILPPFVEEFQKQFKKLRDAQKSTPDKFADPDSVFNQTLEATVKALLESPETKDVDPKDIEKLRLILHQLSELGVSKTSRFMAAAPSSLIGTKSDHFENRVEKLRPVLHHNA